MYPKWCCQKCGQTIGYVGRFLGFIKFPGSHYHGKSKVEYVWVGIEIALLIFIIVIVTNHG